MRRLAHPQLAGFAGLRHQRPLRFFPTLREDPEHGCRHRNRQPDPSTNRGTADEDPDPEMLPMRVSLRNAPELGTDTPPFRPAWPVSRAEPAVPPCGGAHGLSRMMAGCTSGRRCRAAIGGWPATIPIRSASASVTSMVAMTVLQHRPDGLGAQALGWAAPDAQGSSGNHRFGRRVLGMPVSRTGPIPVWSWCRGSNRTPGVSSGRTVLRIRFSR